MHLHAMRTVRFGVRSMEMRTTVWVRNDWRQANLFPQPVGNPKGLHAHLAAQSWGLPLRTMVFEILRCHSMSKTKDAEGNALGGVSKSMRCVSTEVGMKGSYDNSNGCCSDACKTRRK